MQRRLYSLTNYALFSPIYWGLMSIAAYRGFFQLLTRPFYWEKTEHGLDIGRAAAPPPGRSVGGGPSAWRPPPPDHSTARRGGRAA